MNAIVINNQTEPQTIRRLLAEGGELLRAAAIESARLDAEVLLCYVLGIEKAELYLNADSALNMEQEQQFQTLLLRRAKREPLAYITGHKEFWSLDFVVTPDVLIPRPETELLVEVALERAPEACRKSKLKILDIGTGCGAVAIALAKELPNAQVWGADVSATALNVAGVNCRRHGLAGGIQFLHGDVFEPVLELGEIFDLIISNPPYIRSRELSGLAPEIRNWEPAIALSGGLDGLDIYRRIIHEGCRYLAVGGDVLLEIGADMGEAVAELFARAGNYSNATVCQDYAGRDRVIAATNRTQPDRAVKGAGGG